MTEKEFRALSEYIVDLIRVFAQTRNTELPIERLKNEIATITTRAHAALVKPQESRNP